MANISTINELKDTINDLHTSVSIPNGKIGNKLDSANTNLFFKSLENTLNALYVKCRQLEDLHDFTTQFIQKEFSLYKKEIENAINIINNKTDIYTDISKKTSLCNFGNSTIQFDRDGTTLPIASINQNVIMPYNIEILKPDFANYIVERSHYPYRVQESSIENYKAFYIIEDIAPEGITESINIIFKQDTEINYINTSFFGCYIKNIKIIRSDDVVIDINKITTENIKAKGIIISLASDNPKDVNLSVSDNIDTYNILSSIYKVELKDSVFDTYLLQKGEKLNVYKSTE